MDDEVISLAREPQSAAESLAWKRRQAVAAILRPRADFIRAGVLAEARRAVSVTAVLTPEQMEEALTSLPLALDALATDDVQRAALLGEFAQPVRALVGRGVPELVQRGLARIGFLLARGIVREHSRETAFGLADLEAELVHYEAEFERVVFTP